MLKDKAMLVKLSVSQWSGEKEDVEQSKAVCDRNNAVRGTASVVKRIVPERALKPIQQSASRLYNTHKLYTLPWLDNGTRIIKADAFDTYKRAIETEQVTFDSAVETLLNQYPDLQWEAARTQGDLHNPADWPTAERLKGKFGVSMKVFPMPSHEDFRTEIFNKIKQEDRDEIIKQAKEAEQEVYNSCLSDVFMRMRTVVGSLADKVRSYEPGSGKTRMHDSVIENVRNLVTLLPGLNVTDDPRITAMAAEMERNLACWDTETLKASEYAREMVSAAADAFVDKLSQWGY